MAAMRRGDFSTAWQISDAHLQARLARGDPKHVGPRHLQPIWDGESLAGKVVLVRCYHGLGDTIQFIRFAAPLRRIAREVIVWVQPAILPLVATASGVDRVLPLHDGTPDVAYDVDVEIMELAHVLRVDARTIACAIPYLFPRRPKRQLLNVHGRAVGLVWQVGDWAPQRSIPPQLLSRLAHVSSIELYSLQLGAAAEAALIPAKDLSSSDAEEAAANLLGLDLLITVDTFLAHLAGALGIPVWLLLQADCDWRWMSSGDSSIWYPTMRLFRQPRPGDWHSVVEAVATELAACPGSSRVDQL